MLNVDWNVGPYCVACHLLVWWLGKTFPIQIMWLARLGASTYLVSSAWLARQLLL